MCPEQAEPKGNWLGKKRKINYHTVAVKYLRTNGHKMANGNGWNQLTPLLSSVSGIAVVDAARGYKKCGISILKEMGGVDLPKPKKVKPKKKNEVNSAAFLESYEWRKLRYRVLLKYGRTCMCCKAKPGPGRVHVDHIKPRRKYPELALEFDNLQVLCDECNHGKGNWDETEWREPRLSVVIGERCGPQKGAR